VAHGIHNNLFLRQKAEFNKRRFLLPVNATDTQVSLEPLARNCVHAPSATATLLHVT
jgi:hypothetical protein